jgi:hypothetical protein
VGDSVSDLGIQSICSQCKELIPWNKGFTVAYYLGRDERSYKCCSVACVDKLIKGNKKSK